MLLLVTDLTLGFCLRIWCHLDEYFITPQRDRPKNGCSFSWRTKSCGSNVKRNSFHILYERDHHATFLHLSLLWHDIHRLKLWIPERREELRQLCHFREKPLIPSANSASWRNCEDKAVIPGVQSLHCSCRTWEQYQLF